MVGRIQQRILEIAIEGKLTSTIFKQFYKHDFKIEINRMIMFGWIKQVKNSTNPIEFEITKLGEGQI